MKYLMRWELQCLRAEARRRRLARQRLVRERRALAFTVLAAASGLIACATFNKGWLGLSVALWFCGEWTASGGAA